MEDPVFFVPTRDCGINTRLRLSVWGLKVLKFLFGMLILGIVSRFTSNLIFQELFSNIFSCILHPRAYVMRRPREVREGEGGGRRAANLNFRSLLMRGVSEVCCSKRALCMDCACASTMIGPKMRRNSTLRDCELADDGL